jgi:prepilin-type N-terminal cleavage/methylation domain-containing protein
MLTNRPNSAAPPAREESPTALLAPTRPNPAHSAHPARTSGHANTPRRLSLADEHGFSLIELLVAMITGIVICFVLFGILNITTDQASRLTNYAQATQQGRLAMTKIVDALHSACVTNGFAPVVTGSGESELLFVNAYSEQAVIPKEAFHKQKIVWNKAAETLTDYSYPAIKEISWPNFEYSGTASPSTGVLLARNVTQTETGGTKVPVFQYFAYTAESSESATAGLSTLTTKPLEAPLTEKTAPTAASVLITFNAGPNEGTTAIGAQGKGVSAGEQTQVTLSFTVPISNEKVVDAPCQ